MILRQTRLKHPLNDVLPFLSKMAYVSMNSNASSNKDLGILLELAENRIKNATSTHPISEIDSKDIFPHNRTESDNEQQPLRFINPTLFLFGEYSVMTPASQFVR